MQLGLSNVHNRGHEKVVMSSVPSTTGPMTWWIFPFFDASVEANRAASAGSERGLSGSNAHLELIDGRGKAALPRVRVRPLYSIEVLVSKSHNSQVTKTILAGGEKPQHEG